MDAEIKKLRSQLAAKGREVSKCTDAVRKTELQTDVTALKEQISQKDGERKPLISLIEPKKFSKREEAEKYVEALLKQAEKAKEDKKADA